MNHGTAAGRLLLRAFIAFRIETPSGNIFSRANLIKAQQTGLLNKQTVVAPQHASRGDGREGTGRGDAGEQMQFYASVFLISPLSTRAAPIWPAFLPPHAIAEVSFVGGASDLPDFFPLVSHLSAGKKMNSTAKRIRRVRNIYLISSTRYNLSFCVCCFFRNCFPLLYN